MLVDEWAVPKLAQRSHALAPAGQNFVRIGLVAHVPHQAVARGVEHIVQRHGEFHRAQVGAEVPTRLGDTVEHEGAQFVGHALEFGAREAAQIGRRVHGLKQGVSVRGHSLLLI